MKAAWLVVFPVLAASAGAQPAVRGRILSGLDRAVIVSAEVSTIDGRARARTDAHGRYSLAAEPGDSVRVRALGYAERRFAWSPRDSLVILDAFATQLSTVVTTAGQRTIRLNESTASIAVVERTDIDAAAAIGVSQLLRQIPGLQELSTPPSKSTISIRGLDAARVLVLVDGEPVPGALTDTRDIGRLSTVAAERIEVTKGPSSVEFGSDALGGVINLVTAAPRRNPMLDMTARIGGLGRSESTVDLSNTIGPVGVRVSGGWRQLDRLVAVNGEGSSLDRVYDVRSDARYRATDRVTLRGDAQFSQERQRWPVGGGYNGFIDNRSAQAFVDAQRIGERGVLRARVFGQYYNYKFRQSQHMVPIAGSGDSLEQGEKLGRALIAYTRNAGAHTIDAGAQFALRSIVAPKKIDGDSASDRVAELFVRDAWSAGAWLVTVGGRSTTSSLWGNALAPSAGVAWQAAPSVRIRANVARGFRGPSFKEVRYTFANPAAGYVVVGNPDLNPESSWSTEAGIAWAPGSHVAFEFGGYRNRVTNLIDTRVTGVNGAGFQVYQNLNVAHAVTEGIEVGAQVALRGVTASAGYNFLHARDLENRRPLDRRAAHTARAQVSKVWSALRDVTSDLSIHYTGSAPLGEMRQGAFASVDGQIRAGITEQLELSAGVNNLFDARPALWTPAFQRQVYAGARMRLGARD